MLRRPVALVVLAAVLVVVIAAAGLTLLAEQPHAQPDHSRFCFAEWCVAPLAMALAGSTTTVRVEVSSTALGITQRPDHPQAWLVDSAGRSTGGPAIALDRAIGPGASYDADLAYPAAAGGCASFVVAEGGWPPALGLGYAPSPFTERASWRLCPL